MISVRLIELYIYLLEINTRYANLIQHYVGHSTNLIIFYL